ncbi:CoA-transferase [Paenibacillus filicis]|uniref:CoA-transferase n=1 Tax=Paenibacillus filicis TaxID=669464 RepID=A0ABU9DGL7_9BACL
MTNPQTDSGAQAYSAEEWLICLLARQLKDGEVIGVGNQSPIPAAAALLAKALHAPGATAYILGQPEWPFEGTKEFFDYMQRGGIDVFFLSGAQIDAYGSVNLHVIGDYERPKVRLPGGAGSGVVSYVCRRILLFKTDHGLKGFPERLDFVSAAGEAAPSVFRQGQVEGVFTPLGVLRLGDRDSERPRAATDAGGGGGQQAEPYSAMRRLRLAAVAPGVTPAEVQAQTGFDLGLGTPGSLLSGEWGGSVDRPDSVASPDLAASSAQRTTVPWPIEQLEPPTGLELHTLRTRVRTELGRIYPIFAKRSLG